jgi:transitional endoplasmic reticulum ATPase
VNKPWVSQLSRSVQAGRKVNIVHFNVNDEFVHNGQIRTVREIIEEELGLRGYIYASPGSGFSFSDDETELFFRKAAGFPAPPVDPGPLDDVLEASEDEQAAWKRKHDEWLAWQAVAEQYENAGLSPLRALGSLAPIDAMTLAGSISQFTSYMPQLHADEANEKEPKVAEFGIIIEYADSYMGASDSKSWDQKVLSTAVREWSERSSMDQPVIVLAADALVDLDHSLYGRGSATGVIEVPYPDESERLEYITEVLKVVPVGLSGLGVKDVARETAGLANRHIKSMMTEAFVEDKPLDHQYVRTYKEATLQSELNGLVEVICPDHGFETVGGLVKVKDILNKVGGYLNREKSELCPMGILFTGPPGTGKTWVAETWAHDIGYTVIKMGAFRSKWQGESERNLEKVFQIAKALAPVIVFIDEIDQEGSRGNTSEIDGGVNGRIFGNILKIMSDTSLRGKIIFIAATNRPDLMDTAMKRPGRFDIRIPFPFPREAERADIFRAIQRKYNLRFDSGIDFALLAQKADKHSGADIEAICLEAARIADRDGKESIGFQHLMRAMDDYMTHHDAAAIKKMEVAAYKECNSRSLLPDDVVAELEKKAAAKGRVAKKEV